MDDLMSRTMVENLSSWIKPITGERLLMTDIYSNEEVWEALKIVLEYHTLDSYQVVSTKEYKKRKLKEKYSTIDSGRKMRKLYTFEFTIKEMVNILKRLRQRQEVVMENEGKIRIHRKNAKKAGHLHKSSKKRTKRDLLWQN